MEINLDELTTEELRDLGDRIAYRLSTERPSLTRDEITLWNMLCATIPSLVYSEIKNANNNWSAQERAKALTAKMNGIIKKHGVNAFREEAAILARLIQKATGGQKMRIEVRTALANLMGKCLLSNMQERNEEVNTSHFLYSIRRMEYAVNQFYPGYIEAGILIKVAMIQTRGKEDNADIAQSPVKKHSGRRTGTPREGENRA